MVSRGNMTSPASYHHPGSLHGPTHCQDRRKQSYDPHQPSGSIRHPKGRRKSVSVRPSPSPSCAGGVMDAGLQSRSRGRSERRSSEHVVAGLTNRRLQLKLRKMARRRNSLPISEASHRLSDLLKGSTSGIGSVAKWRAKVKAREVKPKIPPLQKFRNYARLAVMCIRLCKFSHENVEAAKDEFLSVIQVTDDYVPVLEQDGVFFDPRHYRANKEARLPADARRLLKMDPRRRTNKENTYLHIILRNIKAFSEYPTKMQTQLCRVGWYEAYEAKRAIVRQGQPPHAFYFILSGSVVVTTFDPKSGGTKFLVSLSRGMSFGELAVITQSRRQATVSTGTATELLCISAKDFEEIFMSGGVKSVTQTDDNSFIRSIPFLKYWPTECLASNPQACMFNYFSRGQVIVRDSNHSDWIYIVKSGSLSVLKKLVEVHPRNLKPQDSGSETDDEADSPRGKNSFGTWQHRVRRRRKKSRRWTEDKQVFRNQMEMEKRLETSLPGFYNSRERLGLIDYDEIIQDHRGRVLASTRRMSQDVGLPSIKVEAAATPPPTENSPEDRDTIQPQEDEKNVKLPKIRRTSKLSVRWEETDDKQASSSKNLLQVPQLKGAYLASKPSKRKSSRKEQLQEELFKKQLEYEKKVHEERTATTGRKTITNELDNKIIKDLTLTEADIRPMFVLVQVLEKGQYFGLTKMVFPEQATSFSVVSNGAECIMISKKFFLDKSTEATMHHLRQVECLFPADDELQSNLQDFVDWKAHRAKIYNRLVRDKITRTTLKRQFPPQYGGQYCFRTGPV